MMFLKTALNLFGSIGSLMEYTIIIHKAEEGGYWAEVPALPGCYSQGEFLEETLENIKEAIETHLEVLKEEKQDILSEGQLVIGRVEITAGSK